MPFVKVSLPADARYLGCRPVPMLRFKNGSAAILNPALAREAVVGPGTRYDVYLDLPSGQLGIEFSPEGEHEVAANKTDIRLPAVRPILAANGFEVGVGSFPLIARHEVPRLAFDLSRWKAGTEPVVPAVREPVAEAVPGAGGATVAPAAPAPTPDERRRREALMGTSLDPIDAKAKEEALAEKLTRMIAEAPEYDVTLKKPDDLLAAVVAVIDGESQLQFSKRLGFYAKELSAHAWSWANYHARTIKALPNFERNEYKGLLMSVVKRAHDAKKAGVGRG